MPLTLQDIRRQHRDAAPSGLVHQLCRLIKAHRLAVEQPGDEGGRLMALEPAGDIGQQRKRGGVGFRETVFAEAEHLPVDLLGELGRVAVFAHAAEQSLAEGLEAALALPGRHRAAQLVGFAGREVGGDHRDLHHLFLENRHAERALEHAAQRRARVADGLGCAAALEVRMHHAALDRAGAHDRDLDDQVVKAARLKARQHAHLRARLDLEHADGVGRGRSCRKWPDPRPGCPAAALVRRDSAPIRARVRRMAVSMPSASTSTLSSPMASRSSLSHCSTVRSGIAAFSMGTSSCERARRRSRSRRHAATDGAESRTAHAIRRLRAVIGARACRDDAGADAERPRQVAPRAA